MNLFGFSIKRANTPEAAPTEQHSSFVAKTDEDAINIGGAPGGFFGQYVDIYGGEVKNDSDLILKYRETSLYPECDIAIDEIVTEAIVSTHTKPVSLNLDAIEGNGPLKTAIHEEFDNVLKLLSFNKKGHDLFRRWYVDGRIVFHNIIEKENPKKGIVELRYVDPSKLTKVSEDILEVDKESGVQVYKGSIEYYLYSEVLGGNQSKTLATGTYNNQAVRINKDAITYVTSGLYDPSRKRNISYLHKALKPANQLRVMEDSLVIYRLARAPERRIFYIDVGELPKKKADAYLNSIIAKYRNKQVYDANTGELKDARKHVSMLEDFFLPRSSTGRGTEITTLPGGENLGQIEDIIYFKKNLYKALNVPLSRLDPESRYSIGRSNDVTREELKFNNFVSRLRQRFSYLFLDVLKTQLMLKGLVKEDEWDSFVNEINVVYKSNTAFAELKEFEVMRDRIDILGQFTTYVGEYYSIEWIRKNILKMSDEEIADMKKQIAKEKAAGEITEEDSEAP